MSIRRAVNTSQDLPCLVVDGHALTLQAGTLTVTPLTLDMRATFDMIATTALGDTIELQAPVQDPDLEDAAATAVRAWRGGYLTGAARQALTSHLTPALTSQEADR